MRRWVLLIVALFSIWFSIPPESLRAMDVVEENTVVCAIRKGLARYLCKNVNDINYMFYRDGFFIFNIFFGANHWEFYVEMRNDTQLIVFSRAWNFQRATFRMVRNYSNGCVQVLVPKSRCTVDTSTTCCMRDFMSAPVPDISPPKPPAPQTPPAQPSN